jgi:hypothetical protein
MLITGDEVTIDTSSNGTTSYTVDPAPGSRGYASYQGSNGDRYIIPAVAVPYLNQLNIALFDVTTLAAAGGNSATKLPVDLYFASGVAPKEFAGVTITSVAGGTAAGYVTRSSAPAFTSALRAQIGADVAAGHPAGTSPLSADIGPAGSPLSSAAVQPRYPLHILQLNTVDMTGEPAGALIVLMDTDSAGEEKTVLGSVGGIARIAVPSGHYFAEAIYFDFNAQGAYLDSRQVIDDDFVVPDSSNTTVATIDERAATTPITVQSPRPAAEDMVVADLTRFDATGSGESSVSNEVLDGYPLYVNPVAKPAVGSLHYVVDWEGASSDAKDPYHVDLAFPADQVPADESFVGKASELATVHEVMYSDPTALTDPTSVASAPMDPTLEAHGLAPSATSFLVPTGGVSTDYVGTADGGGWTQYAYTAGAFLSAEPSYFHAGQVATVNWGAGPLTAGLGQSDSPTLCLACSSGDTVLLGIPPLKDGADHSGQPTRATMDYTLYLGNTVLLNLNGTYGGTANVPQAPETLRAVLTVDQAGSPSVSQGVKSQTEETVQYDPSAEDTPLPGFDSCYQDAALTPCQVLGAITVVYHLAGSDLTNTTHSRVQFLGLDVGHVSYNGVGSRSPITAVTVSVSFDNGVTWQPTVVLGTRGRYAAMWPNPSNAVGTSPWLKVTAEDSAGDAFEQTTSSAYTIGDFDNRASGKAQ